MGFDPSQLRLGVFSDQRFGFVIEVYIGILLYSYGDKFMIDLSKKKKKVYDELKLSWNFSNSLVLTLANPKFGILSFLSCSMLIPMFNFIFRLFILSNSWRNFYFISFGTSSRCFALVVCDLCSIIMLFHLQFRPWHLCWCSCFKGSSTNILCWMRLCYILIVPYFNFFSEWRLTTYMKYSQNSFGTLLVV